MGAACMSGTGSAMLAADAVYRTEAKAENIRTLRMRYLGTEQPERANLRISADVLAGGEWDLSDEKNILELSFDELTHEQHNYSYRLIHCDRFWQQDRLMESEYMSGMRTAEVEDVTQSMRTTQLYTHYTIPFPNEQMQPRVSGNYALLVYEDLNEDQPVATFCFRVVEDMVRVRAEVLSNTDKALAGPYQQLEITVNIGNMMLTQQEDLCLIVQQNGREDNQVVAPRATYVDGQQLRWQHCRDLIFEGGNEYRHMDLSSVYILGAEVEHVGFEKQTHAICPGVQTPGAYHAWLFASERRAGTPYIYMPDANGQWLVNVERTQEDDTEGEYMFVHFFLPAPEGPMLDGTVHITGDAFGTLPTPLNRMQYDFDNQCYTYTTYLKQGAYEWQYAFKKKGSSQGSLVPLEGSYWQTGNEYDIWVYRTGPTERYDRLISGCKL